MSNFAPNQKSYSKDDTDFMQSIYNKVSALRENLQSYEANQVIPKKTNDPIPNSHLQAHLHLGKMQMFSSHPKLSLVTLNDQSKIHRDSLLLKIKAQPQPDAKFYTTALGFSTTHRTFPNLSQNMQTKGKQRSLSTFNLTSKILSNRTKDFSRSSAKKQPQEKRYFSSKQLFSNQSAQIKENKVPPKISLNHNEKGRTQNKMNRIAGFLGKNDNKGQKQRKLQDYLKTKRQAAENEEVTLERRKIQDSDKFQDSYENFDDFHAIQSLKQQKRGLQQRQTFRPIGSANGLRNSASKHYTTNSDNESNLLNAINQKTQTVIQERASSPERQSALKKSYLQKGNRFREALYKKLMKGDAKQGQEMIYVKEYDQWVPSKLAETNRKELESFMKMLLGEKKQQKAGSRLSLDSVDLVYF